MPAYRDYLDELFIDKLNYEPDFQTLTKPAIDGVENLLSLSRDYVHGSIAVIVAECKDRLPVFQKQLIREYKKTYPDAHFLFISNGGKVFDLYNYSTSKKLKAISYNEIEKNTKLFKEKIQFFKASDVTGSADLKVQIEKAFETSDRITKKFYDNFKGIHDKLTKAIKGITDEHERNWYATTLLNRIMFIFFLQKNNVLQGDADYLITKYNEVKRKGGNYYKDFLLPLFFKGFAKKNSDPEKKAFVKEYGEVKYLNGGLFYPNKIEQKYASVVTEKIEGVRVTIPDGTNPDIDISNNALHEVITFLNGYTWYLDNRPTKDEKEINPDVLGYIFEKYINQKQLGAYYTKEDITEYISKSTIIPFVFDKLRSNGYDAPDPTPLITNNEDIITAAQTFITECEDYSTLKYLYKDVLQPMSVLDPAVGSGAFLFAALNILLPLYQHTVAKLKTFKGKVKDEWLSVLLQNISGHPEEYFLTKQIILSNLYGVDIVEEGVEICKLRLFLQLASHLADIQTIEPLPDIDFNIYAGNSLVGGLSWKDLQGNYAMSLYTKDDKKLDHDELQNDIRTLQKEKKKYKELQADENIDEKTLKKQKAAVQGLENKINNAIDIGIDNPFHWFVEYAEIINNGGFDVIIGNPPYVEYSKIKDYKVKNYATESCGNLYAFFIERAFKLVGRQGKNGMIVPVSAIASERATPVQKMFLEKGLSFFSSYSNRPAKLFDGVEQRLLVYIHSIQETKGNIFYTSRYNHWYADEREYLFKSIRYYLAKYEKTFLSIPKGDSTDLQILKQVNLVPQKLINSTTDSKSKSVLYYHDGPTYWIRAMNFEPAIVKLRPNSHYKPIYFSSSLRRNIVTAILNSSTFYIYFKSFSNCRDFSLREIGNFNVDLSELEENYGNSLNKLSEELMTVYKKTKKVSTRKYPAGVIEFEEYFPKNSKEIIDKIDKVLANYYGLNEKQYSHVINYELKYRFGNESEE